MCGKCQVTLTKGFFIGIFELTQKQYKLIMGSLPPSEVVQRIFGDALPVEGSTWNLVRGASWPTEQNASPSSFMGVLSARTGLSFDLPTEAQWEYACRAGTTSSYNNGGDEEADLMLLGRFKSNLKDGKGGKYPTSYTTVGSYLPNDWGLYDMHGNMWEMCLDYFSSDHYASSYYYAFPASATDPTGPSSGEPRMMRGGGFESNAQACSSSYRMNSINPDRTVMHLGFRVKCVVK